MSTALSRSLPFAIALGDVRSAELTSSSEITASPRDSNASSSRASLPRSESESSLESSSTSSSPTTSDLRKHLNTVKPSKSCLSARDRNGRRKNVTFASDSSHTDEDHFQSPSSPNLSSSSSETHDEAQLNEEILSQSVRSSNPRDREHKHMEAKALLQYHANIGIPGLHDSTETPPSPLSLSRSSSPISDSPLMNSSSNMDSHTNLQETQHETPEEGSNSASNSPNFGSPLSGLRSIGSELDRSNSVLQSFMQRAAMPETESKDTVSQNGWMLSASILVTAPVVFSLVMDTILG